jgi:hypothetical protein
MPRELLELIDEACNERQRRIVVGLYNSGGEGLVRPPQRCRATSLEKLEKHLHVVFAHELADLYWHAGERIVRHDPHTAPYLNPESRPRRRRDLFESNPWRARAQSVLRVVSESPGELTPHLEHLTRLVAGEPVSLVEIARAGYSLRPLASYRFHEAFGLEITSNIGAAKRLLRAVYEAPLAGRDRAAAAQNLGRLASLEGDVPSTIDHYRIASAGDPWNIDAACYWLELTLWYDLGPESTEALIRLEGAASRNEAAYSTYLQRRRATLLGKPDALPGVPATLRRAAGPNGARLLDLLGQPPNPQ